MHLFLILMSLVPHILKKRSLDEHMGVVYEISTRVYNTTKRNILIIFSSNYQRCYFPSFVYLNSFTSNLINSLFGVNKILAVHFNDLLDSGINPDFSSLTLFCVGKQSFTHYMFFTSDEFHFFLTLRDFDNLKNSSLTFPDSVLRILNYKPIATLNFDFDRNIQFVNHYFRYHRELPFPDCQDSIKLINDIKNGNHGNDPPYDINGFLDKIAPGYNDASKRCRFCGGVVFKNNHIKNCCFQRNVIVSHLLTKEVPDIIINYILIWY